MTMWAMLLVEFVHPLMKSMQRDGALEGCKDCADAASSVMQANLLLFKTVGAPKNGSLSQLVIVILGEVYYGRKHLENHPLQRSRENLTKCKGHEALIGYSLLFFML